MPGRPRQPTHLIPTGLERDLLSALELLLTECEDRSDAFACYYEGRQDRYIKAVRTRRINKAKRAIDTARTTKKFVKIWTQKKEITK